MKKLVPLLVVGFLILSGFGAAKTLTSNNNDGNTETTIEIENFNLDVGEPTFSYQDEFITIELDESEAFMSHSGEPMLPVISKTFDFPVGTRIGNVNVDIDWERYDLDRKVTPTPISMPTSVEVDPAILEEQRINEDVYSSDKLYPSEPYTIKIGAGLQDMEHVIFVNVKCFPQYSPANDYINIPTKININVEYEPAETPVQNGEQYDLLIITHEAFEDELQPLVAHKESKGLSTKMVTVDEIYEDYDGAGDWEEIKMYLADHVLDWDTKFVLLAGGHKGQTYEWYVPDFRSHNWDPEDELGTWDETYSTDLYYADVYYVDMYGHFLMETWDSNGNGIYAEGPLMPSGPDVMDFYPDVYVGRLPMRYEWEADVAVNKIVTYENTADDSWFKKAVLAGGDGFPPERYPGQAKPGIWEGEIVCDIIADTLSSKGIESTKCYCSYEGDIKVNSAADIYNEVSKGCGFVHLTGHSCPFSLGSYEPDTGISPPPLTAFYNGFDARLYDCGDKLPFMVCEGCHNCQFDVTGQELIDYLLDAYDQHPDYGFDFFHYEWIPHDVSSWFVLQEGGGAIGVIGNTALGSGYINDGTTHGLGGWMCIRLFEAYAVDNKEYTGSVWATGINGYIDNFDMGWDADRKRVEAEVLLGDPSVKLGGYGSLSVSDDSEETEEKYGPVSASAPTWSVGDSWTYALDNIDIDLTPIEGRSVTLKLNTEDIKLEVTEVRSDTYIASVKADGTDVTFGGVFDFHVEDVEDINIPTVSLDNINIDGQITFDKETLGIINLDLGLNIELVENLENIEEALGFEFPALIYKLAPYMSIPANIDVNLAFDEPFEILQFPLENENMWGIPANTVTVTIDGSIESIWLRILNFLNKFINIVPEEIAKYLPNIDISEVLNDFGIDTTYEIDIPEVPANLLSYHKDTTALFEVKGSENINTQAGSFNAVKISIIKDNGKIYYSESEGNIVKMIGYVGDYIPIIEDINLELKE